MTRFVAVTAALAVLAPCLAGAYPLTDEQLARLKQYLPNSYAKLANQGPAADKEDYHILVLGDSISEFFHQDANVFDSLDSYHGRFAHRLEREFFFTGGVRLFKPKSGMDAKHHDHMGPEIVIENAARGGQVMLHAMQMLTTHGFLNEPDLVLINYGVNDTLRGLPLANFREGLNRAISICQAKKVDVIVFGSTPAFSERGILQGLGVTRCAAAVARDVAEEKGVLFVELARALSTEPGVGAGLDPQEAIAEAMKPFKKHFVSEKLEEDYIHPAARAHKALGDFAFEVLMDGEPPDDYTGESGIVTQQGPGLFEVAFELKNHGDEPREGYFCALNSMTFLEATEPFQQFSLKPGESELIKIAYQLKGSRDFAGQPAYELLPAAERSWSFPFVIADADKTQMITVRAEPRPIALNWKTGLQDGVTETLILGATVVNTGDKPVQGDYVVTWRGQEARGQIALGPKEEKDQEFSFQMPQVDGMLRMNDPVEARFTIGGKQFNYRRVMEATRAIALGQRVPMARADRYVPGKDLDEMGNVEDSVSVRVEADQNALYVLFDIPPSIDLSGIPEGAPAMVADLMIDARPYDYIEDRSVGKRREFGYVAGVRVYGTATDGPGRAASIKRSAFGNGYSRLLDSEQIGVQMETRSGGGRRLTVTVPRVYFYLHEWSLGNPNSMLGFDAWISFAVTNPADNQGMPYDAIKRYLLTNTRYHDSFAPGLGTLELSEEGTGRWSVKLY